MAIDNYINKIISFYTAGQHGIMDRIYLNMGRFLHRHEYPNTAKNPLISVYIPTYNRVEMLMDRSIPSILDQTYDNFELLIIGDHCTDNTEKYVKNIDDARIKFFNIKKREYRYPPTAENHWLAGPVVAANTALGLVSGKWIARIDDDDTWDKKHLENSLDFACRNDFEFVSSRVLEEKEGIDKIDCGLHAQSEYYTRKKSIAQGYNPKIGGTATWLYRSYLRNIKYNINCWRKNWNRVNDTDLSIRLYKAGVKMGFLDELHAFIRPRPGETTTGQEAYLKNEAKTNRHFRFDENKY